MFIPLADRDLTRRSFPVVNVSLIAICAFVFLYELISSSDAFFYQFGFIPFELTHGVEAHSICGNFLYFESPPGFLSPSCQDVSSPIPTWATVFTSMFVHGGWMHFFGNMVFLWVFGDNIEDRFGHFRYLLFYLASGAAAAALQLAIDPSSVTPTIGASGAIAGVLGAYLVLYPLSRVDTLVFIMVVSIPAVFLLGFWFLLQFFNGIGELGASAQTGGVAYWAHIGGFILGLIVAMIYKLAKGQRLWPGGGGSNSHSGGPPEVKYWRGGPIDY